MNSEQPNGDQDRMRVHKGQRYECSGMAPYTNRNGVTVQLIEWQSQCLECGAPFTYRCKPDAPAFAPSRRCPAHHKPGKTVGRRKRKGKGQ